MTYRRMTGVCVYRKRAIGKNASAKRYVASAVPYTSINAPSALCRIIISYPASIARIFSNIFFSLREICTCVAPKRSAVSCWVLWEK